MDTLVTMVNLRLTRGAVYPPKLRATKQQSVDIVGAGVDPGAWVRRRRRRDAIAGRLDPA